MNKQILRKQFLQKRKQLFPQDIEQASHAIKTQFFNYFSINFDTLHIFLPITKQNEINTWPIIKQLFQQYPQVQVVIPKTNIQHQTLSHHFLDSNTKLIQNRWGIEEPIEAPTCAEKAIDMVLIPLLCFDQQGNRVGYGKGFYDRFLAECRADVIKVGLSLFDPIVQISDAHAHDVQLDYCITPYSVIQTQSHQLLNQ
ncbi:5-formyltetrahydrofolate cyclo-ligase [Candidatus Albibeggiatoa sp. nov. NOAA]|uniref:5-formyltetrahydrofolate cyclo-ligase n=1 Tax=Candidatus Albibeggiatoa sp. nov. NOAA TaxID=3162724 RepID=UPI0032FEFD24|nr:5-formyltetrahydrofolate cyclo-ligase [Thiotrichaceae bacterium]